MRYRVLGPLEVSGTDGRPIDVGGAKPRALLTLLLAEANRVVGVDRIVAALWGDDPPPTVTGTLQAYVSHLRRVLEPGRGPCEAPAVLLTRSPGYLLPPAPADLDAARRLAISLSGPEVRPHVLWQQAGAAWLRGAARRADELTTEAYELYRRVTPHARHAYAAHFFTLRRGDHRLPERSTCWSRPATRGTRCCSSWRCWRPRSPAISGRPGGCAPAGAERRSATGP